MAGWTNEHGTFHNQGGPEVHTLTAPGGFVAPPPVSGMAPAWLFYPPWDHPDADRLLRRLSLNDLIAPRLTAVQRRARRVAGEARWRVKAAWRALRYGEDETW